MDFERGLLRRIGLASTAVGAILFAGLPMAEPAWAGDGNMFSSVTDFFKSPFGGGKPAADNNANGAIDYRPRPALVVPPSYNLPPPQTHVAHVPDWPKEPDAVALRKAKADSRRPAPPSDASAGDDTPSPDASAPSQDNVAAAAPAQSGSQSGRPMSCSAVAGTPVCVSTPWANVDLPNLGNIPGLNLIPGLKKSDQKSAASDIHLNPNPSRKYLTDPPVDYMEAVQLPESDQGSDKGQNKTEGGSQGIVRAPPTVDKTPPGK
ncbi:MAG: hypothetical protein ACYC5H_16075 [Methylovirgula sp.]